MEIKYTLPVLYYHESVFDKAGDELEKKRTSDAYKLLFTSSLVNTKLTRIVNIHASYTTNRILKEVKDKEYSKKFVGLCSLGKNLAHPDLDKDHVDKNISLVKCANDKDSEVIGEVFVVAHGVHTIAQLQTVIDTENYSLKAISVEQALEKITYILNYIDTTLIPSLKE